MGILPVHRVRMHLRVGPDRQVPSLMLLQIQKTPSYVAQADSFGNSILVLSLADHAAFSLL